MTETLANFRLLARGLEVGPALAEIASRPELWNLITVRQLYEGSAHADTESIILRGPTTLEGIFDNLEARDFPYFKELPATHELLRSVSALLKSREHGRVMLARLKAGGRILKHIDEGAYARYYARFHVALTTSPACTFHCGDEQVHMSVGELWWFNHQLPHHVENPGPERVHLIFDATAPGFTGALGRAP